MSTDFDPTPRWGWPHLVAGTLVVLFGGLALVQKPTPKPGDTRGWEVDQFVEHLNRKGLKLHELAGRRVGPVPEVFLTEAPDLTWESARLKTKFVEHIHQWQGTVCVWKAHPEITMDGQLREWGPYGCQIGEFQLFGDEQVLLKIWTAFFE